MQTSVLDEQHITMKCPTMQVENKVGHNQTHPVLTLLWWPASSPIRVPSELSQGPLPLRLRALGLLQRRPRPQPCWWACWGGRQPVSHVRAQKWQKRYVRVSKVSRAGLEAKQDQDLLTFMSEPWTDRQEVECINSSRQPGKVRWFPGALKGPPRAKVKLELSMEFPLGAEFLGMMCWTLHRSKGLPLRREREYPWNPKIKLTLMDC